MSSKAVISPAAAVRDVRATARMCLLWINTLSIPNWNKIVAHTARPTGFHRFSSRLLHGLIDSPPCQSWAAGSVRSVWRQQRASGCGRGFCVCCIPLPAPPRMTPTQRWGSEGRENTSKATVSPWQRVEEGWGGGTSCSISWFKWWAHTFSTHAMLSQRLKLMAQKSRIASAAGCKRRVITYLSRLLFIGRVICCHFKCPQLQKMSSCSWMK